MWSRARDALALAIVIGAAIAGIVVWDYGKVDIGMTLRADPDRVVVDDVTPGGNAARNGFYPDERILDLTTVDGSEVERGEPLGLEIQGAYRELYGEQPLGFNPFGSVGAEMGEYDGTYRPPIEAVDSANIASAVGGDVEIESGWVGIFARGAHRNNRKVMPMLSVTSPITHSDQPQLMTCPPGAGQLRSTRVRDAPVLPADLPWEFPTSA